MKPILLAVSSLLCLVAVPARAQYTNYMSGRQFNNIYAANADRIMSQMVQSAGYAAMRASIEGQVKKPAVARPAAAAPPAKPAYQLPLSATDFKPAGPRLVPEQLAAQVPDQERAQLTEAGRALIKGIESAKGFRKHNVASAATVFLAIAIMVSSGVELNDAQSEVMMRQLNDQLGATEAFKQASAAQRTKMYDTFLVVGGFIGVIGQLGDKGDSVLQRQAKDMARDALAQFGVVL